MSHRLLGQLTPGQIDEFFSGRSVSNTKTYVATVSQGKPIDPTTNEFVNPVRLESECTAHYKKRSYHEQVNYAAKFREEERRKLLHRNDPDEPFDDAASTVSGLSAGASTFLEGIETESYHGSVLTVEPTQEKDVKVYDTYDLTPRNNPNLPISKYREEIVNKIESNSVTIIQGSTGSGKTTQVPQYILDQYAKDRRWCNIIITQPRRIAAQSIANRVCQERGWAPGSLCGYQISMEKQVSPDTRILYMTTGVLLQILANEANLHRFSHVILDEVHERDQYTDFCLLVCRKYLRDPRNSPRTKLILMSATFDCDRFADYFSVPICGRLEPAPVITVEGRIFDVDEYYVEDITPLTGKKPMYDAGDPQLCDEVKELIWKLIDHFDKLEIQEQGKAGEDGLAEVRGTVLVFLPGFAEICAVQEGLLPMSTSKSLKLLPVHSSLTMREQVEVFRPPGGRHRKVILSTNISESSITVPDIQYVIDSCLTKNLVCDEDTNYPILQLDWASKANCIQRRGRAGRVARGRVYRMVTREFYEEVLLDYTIPEIRRCPLDQLVLKAKMLSEAEEKRNGTPFPPKALLALAIDPPLLDDIERTILSLKEVSALSNRIDGRPSPYDGELTFVGRVLSRLPCDTRLGKLIIYGYVFGVLEDAIIVAAALSSRSVFANPFHEKYKAFCRRLHFSGMSMSDCFAVLNAYKLWHDYKTSGRFKRGNVSEFSWCQQHYLEKRRLEEVEEMVKELQRRLSFDCGIETPREHHRRRDGNWKETEFRNTMILKIVMCAAFYPNYFIRNHINNEEASREMCGMDPCTTVMVRGLPAECSLLYRSQLERAFRDKLPRNVTHERPFNVPQITFEGAKAYIEFESDSLSTCKVAPVVIEVLNMRYHFPIRLEPIEARVAGEKMKQVHQELERVRNDNSCLRTNRVRTVRALTGSAPPSSVQTVQLPRPDQTYLILAVRVVKDCGHFWATYGQETTEDLLETISHEIRDHIDVHPMPMVRNAKPGSYCLAPYYGDYYRARLESTEMINGENMAWVFFLDYGNEECVPVGELFAMPSSMLKVPFQAMECHLAHIKPAEVGRYEGGYSPAAKDFFTRNVLNRSVMAEIYSVVNGKIRCSISIWTRVRDEPDGIEININNELIRNRMAEPAEEGFLSKQNNQFRVQARTTGSCDADAPTVTVTVSDDGLHDFSGRQRNAQKIKVFGPYSPYEVTWSGLTRATNLRSVNVERDSVNNITVDDDPYDENDRLLVAANVNMTPGRSSVLLRHTSVMPPVPGLTTLVSLLFTPYAEMRTDAARTRYTGALCGLGPDENGVAIYPDHDMEISFDVKIDDDELGAINSLRNNISVVLGGRDRAQLMQYSNSRNQNMLRTRLIDLILRRRESMESTFYTKHNRWNQIPEHLICAAVTDSPEDELNHILPLHQGVLLMSDGAEGHPGPAQPAVPAESPQRRKERLIQNIQQLRSRASRSAVPEKFVCELCETTLDNPRNLMIHLHSREHKGKEAELLD